MWSTGPMCSSRLSSARTWVPISSKLSTSKTWCPVGRTLSEGSRFWEAADGGVRRNISPKRESIRQHGSSALTRSLRASAQFARGKPHATDAPRLTLTFVSAYENGSCVGDRLEIPNQSIDGGVDGFIRRGSEGFTT